MARICKINRSKISTPDIPTGVNWHNRGSKSDRTLFEHVKYISVVKTYESEKPFKIKGIPRITRTYGIGVLTDSNKYYFSEVHCRHNELTRDSVTKFQQILVNSYIIDNKTHVVISENMCKDPLRVFLGIVVSVSMAKLHIRTQRNMMKIINRRYQYVKVDKSVKFYNMHMNVLMKKLIEYERFEFLTDPDWYSKLDLMTKPVKAAFLQCAVGILYLNCMEQRTTYFRRSMEKRRLRELEQRMNQV